ncbi:MAG: hypothetical protein ACP5QN_03250, partial [Minisyncoccia bacterium]
LINSLFKNLSEKKVNELISKKIKELKKQEKEIKCIILRHGIKDEKEAYEIESAIIDFLLFLKYDLANKVKGHHSDENGLKDLEELKIQYEAKEAKFEEPCILININQKYNYEIKDNKNALYEATRKDWIINPKKSKKIKIACAVYKGIIREIFIIKKWIKSKNKNRFYFIGEIANSDLRNQYLNKSVKKYWEKGSRNPIKYVNI